MMDSFEPRYPLRARGPAMAGGPVTCATCGCRLTGDDDGLVWFHFTPLGGRDARGHRIDCAERAHDAHGHVAELSTA